MKLYNILQDIILEEISKDQQLINEGVLEDIKSAMGNTVYVWFKYKTDDGVITDRYGHIDKQGTTLADNGGFRFWQVGGKSTNTKRRDDGGVVGSKIFNIDKVIPNSVRLTNMKADKPISPGVPYNPTGDKKMKGAITIANYKK